jgi:hypothetical protein
MTTTARELVRPPARPRFLYLPDPVLAGHLEPELARYGPHRFCHLIQSRPGIADRNVL